MKLFITVFVLIISVFLAIIVTTHLIDASIQAHQNHYFYFLRGIDYATIQSSVGSFAEVATGLFGLIITVISIIVNLSANRYTSKIIDLFIRNRLNIFILIYYAVLCLLGLWMTNTVQMLRGSPILPTVEVFCYLILTSLGIAFIVPYFIFIFQFLKPDNVIQSIESQGFKLIDSISTHKNTPGLQADFVQNIEQLAEISKGASVQSDRSLALQSLKAMNKIVCYYIEKKNQRIIPEDWYFNIADHFLGLNSEVIDGIEVKRQWVEYRVLQEYHSILNHFLLQDPKVSYQIAINTTEIGSLLAEHKDIVNLNLVRRYFNTYIRDSIEKGALQATADIFYQYYIFVKALLPLAEDRNISRLCLLISRQFKEYGHYAVRNGQFKILSVVAYFLRKINEDVYRIFKKDHVLVEKMLAIFLEVDDIPEDVMDLNAWLGVRRHQVIMAGFYYLKQDMKILKKIVEDFTRDDITPARLGTIVDSIIQNDEEENIEIDNVGINSLYVNNTRIKAIKEFYNDYVR